MTVCRVPGCSEHYGCRLRAKGIAIAPSATPSRMNQKPPPKANPAWERGVAGEHRVDGSFMPYVNEHGSPIHLKEFGEKRKQFGDRVKRLKGDPNVFSAERQTPA